MRPLLLLALLAGCAGRSPADGDAPADSDPPVRDDVPRDTALDDTWTPDTDDGGSGGPACPSRIVETIPARGATDVFFRPDLRVTFSRDERATATFALTRGVNQVALGPVEWADEGRTAVVRPEQGLLSSTRHELHVRWSCGTETFPFTTGAVGGPVPDPGALIGTTYVADLRTGQVIQPAAISAVFHALLQGASLDLALAPESHDPVTDELVLVAGWLDQRAYVQDPCVPTVDLPPADFSRNPWFELSSPGRLDVPLLGRMLGLYDVGFSGGFRADGGAIEGLRVDGMLDLRDVAPLLGQSDAGVLCTLVEALSSAQAGCVPCPDGDPYCVGAVIGNVTAVPVPGANLVRRTPDDVFADPMCW